MSTTPNDKLRELLKDFSIAMLVTRTSEGLLRGRPMALAEVQADGTIWLLTDRRSGKVEELDQDSHVVITMQSKTKFVSLSGTASPVEDRAKVAEIWNVEWKVWFPGGKEDPNLLLLRIDGKEAEYWDDSGIGGMTYLIEAGKAFLSGTRPDVMHDPKLHGKVHF